MAYSIKPSNKRLITRLISYRNRVDTMRLGKYFGVYIAPSTIPKHV
jgi:hypothetical protein